MNSFTYQLKTHLAGVFFGPAFALGFVVQIMIDGFTFGREQYMKMREGLIDETERRNEAAIQKEVDKLEKDTGHFLGIM